MFQEALEQLILLCLNPYLEGIRLGSLHKGIWNGLIELKELKVKPEVLALLGVPGFRVEKGHINLIRLVIPWSSLASGKVSLEVSGIHIEARSAALIMEDKLKAEYGLLYKRHLMFERSLVVDEMKLTPDEERPNGSEKVAPANVLAEVRFSDLSVKLHDDAEEETSLLRKVLELYVYSTEFTAAVQTGPSAVAAPGDLPVEPVSPTSPVSPVSRAASMTQDQGKIDPYRSHLLVLHLSSSVRMELAFEDTMLMVATKREEFNVISPLPIDIKLNHCETDDALTEPWMKGAELGLTTGDLTLVAAPQALAVLAKLPDVFAELAPAEQPAEQVQITLAEPTEQVDRSKMVSEVAEKSEAVQAATQRAKELTDAGRDHGVGKAWNWAWLRMKRAGGGFYSVFWREHNFEQHILAEEKRLKVNLVARTGKLEVAVLDLIHPVLTLQSRILENGIEVSTLLSSEGLCDLSRLAALGPIFAASLGEGRFAEKTRYRAINLSGRPLQLHFLAPSGQSRSKELLPDGSEVSLEDEVLTYGASEITVTLKGEEASEPLSVESCHATEIPGTFCVAEMLMPEPGCRTLLLASPLRVHNTCDVPLELKVRNGQQARGTFSCNAAFLGEAPAAYAVQSNLRPRDLASKAEDTCLLMPNETWPKQSVQEEGHGQMMLPSSMEILAVPEFAIEKGDALRADLLMRPFAEGHEFSTSFSLSNHLRSESYTFPVTCGREAEEGPASLPRILGSKDNGGYGYIQRKADEKVRVGAEKDEGLHETFLGMLRVVRLTVRPALTLVNAVPEMDMNVGYRTPSKAMPNLLDRRPWKEVPLPSMVAVNVYELPAEAHDRGVELRTHLGTEEETPWSSVVLLRSSALENSAEMLEMDAKLSATGGTWDPLDQLGLKDSKKWDDLKPEEELQLLCNGAPLPKINDFTLLPTNCESKKCEVHVRRFVEGTLREMKLNVTMPVAFDTFDCKTPWGTGYYCIQTED
eukprot:g3152.t1